MESEREASWGGEAAARGKLFSNRLCFPPPTSRHAPSQHAHAAPLTRAPTADSSPSTCTITPEQQRKRKTAGSDGGRPERWLAGTTNCPVRADAAGTDHPSSSAISVSIAKPGLMEASASLYVTTRMSCG